ncbi:uncharacterized protein LOC135482561 [Lineus longissimus]|uniref:uncharacterized protein LOC135482561 n=1 Tax=Lineus longissimus TaxID=88925 RepID=UPI00315D7045
MDIFKMQAERYLKDNYSEVLTITIYLTILGTIGIIGNGIVIYIYLLKFPKNSSNIFITYLAVIDFLICLIIIPFTLVKEWYTEITSDIVCRLMQGIDGSMMPMSMCILIAIAVERFCLIYFMPSIVTTPKQAAIAIVFIIFFAICTGMPLAVASGVYVLYEAPTTGKSTYIYFGFCSHNSMFISRKALKTYWAIMSCFFGLMMLTMIMLYSAIFVSVYRRSYLFHKKMQHASKTVAAGNSLGTASKDKQVTELTTDEFKSKSLKSVEKDTSPPFMARKVAPEASPTERHFKEMTPDITSSIRGSISKSELTLEQNRPDGDLLGDQCRSEESFTNHPIKQSISDKSKQTDTQVDNKINVHAPAPNVDNAISSNTDVHAHQGHNTSDTDVQANQTQRVSTIGTNVHLHEEHNTSGADVEASQGQHTDETDMHSFQEHTCNRDVQATSKTSDIGPNPENLLRSQTCRATITIDTNEGDVMALTTIRNHDQQEIVIKQHKSIVCRDDGVASSDAISSSPPYVEKMEATCTGQGGGADTILPFSKQDRSNKEPEINEQSSGSKTDEGQSIMSEVKQNGDAGSGTTTVKPNRRPLPLILDSTSENISVISLLSSQPQRETTHFGSRRLSATTSTTASRPASGIAANSRLATGQNTKTRPTSAMKTKLPHLLTAKVLLIVTVTFIISYLPMILIVNGIIPENRILFYMYFINNAANPIIYSSMNKRFQEKLIEVYHKCPGIRRGSRNGRP